MIGLLLSVAFALDLDEVRARADARAISVETASARADAARADARAVFASNLPAITAFASANTGQGFTAFGFQRPVQNQTGVGVRGQWVVLAPSQWAAARAARQGFVGQQAMLQWSRVDARREATNRYAALWAAQREVQALEQAVESATSAAEAVGELVEAGLRPSADRARATADAATAQADLQTARWNLRSRCSELRSLLREDPAGDCDIEPPSWGEPREGPASHPALDAAKAALTSAEASTLSATLALAPTLSANGNAAWYQTSNGGGLGWSAGLEANQPVFAGGAGWAERAGATAEADVARLALEQQELDLRTALAASAARFDAAQSALQARGLASEAAAQALLLVDARYRAGTAELTALLDARRARDAAAVALARAEAEVGFALAELEAARGVAPEA